MLLAKNPTSTKITEIINRSSERAAKWFQCSESGDRYFWEAEKAFHRDVASWLGIMSYTKRLAVNDQESAPSRADHAASASDRD